MPEHFQLPDLNWSRHKPDGTADNLSLTTETKLIALEADNLGIAWEVVPNTYILKLTYQGHIEFMRDGVTTTNREPGRYICVDKYLTREFLKYAQIPVAKGFCIVSSDSLEYRKKIFDELQKPLVVKPSHGTHGNGIKLNVTNFEEMNGWVNEIFSNYEGAILANRGSVMVEETVRGDEYRIIATKEKVLAVMSRRPAAVIGDGESTIRQLIDKKNQEPIRNISQDLYPHINLDHNMIQIIQEQQLQPESIPAEGQHITLRRISNIMAGGDAIDVTDEVHSSVRDLAIKIAQAMPSMTLVGIDFMTTDIFADQATQDYFVIEVNSTPEYAMHDIPMYGKKRGVAKEILLMMFPELL